MANLKLTVEGIASELEPIFVLDADALGEAGAAAMSDFLENFAEFFVEYKNAIRRDVRINGIEVLSTADIPEAYPYLYFNESRVLNTVLSSYEVGPNSAVNTTDTVLSAIQKLQSQIDSSVTGIGVADRLAIWSGVNLLTYNDLLKYDGTTLDLGGRLIIRPNGYNAINVRNSSNQGYFDLYDTNVTLYDPTLNRFIELELYSSSTLNMYWDGVYSRLSFDSTNLKLSSVKPIVISPNNFGNTFGIDGSITLNTTFTGVGTRGLAVDSTGKLVTASYVTASFTDKYIAVGNNTGGLTGYSTFQWDNTIATLGITGAFNIVGTASAVAGLAKHNSISSTLSPTANFDHLAALYINATLSNPTGFSTPTLYGIYLGNVSAVNYMGAGMMVSSLLPTNSSYKPTEYRELYLTTGTGKNYQMRVGDNFTITDANGLAANTTFLTNSQNIMFFGGVSTLGGNQSYKIKFGGSKTAVTTLGRYIEMTPTLVAAANGDTLTSIYIDPIFTLGSFTSVNTWALVVNNGNTKLNRLLLQTTDTTLFSNASVIGIVQSSTNDVFQVYDNTALARTIAIKGSGKSTWNGTYTASGGAGRFFSIAPIGLTASANGDEIALLSVSASNLVLNKGVFTGVISYGLKLDGDTSVLTMDYGVYAKIRSTSASINNAAAGYFENTASTTNTGTIFGLYAKASKTGGISPGTLTVVGAKFEGFTGNTNGGSGTNAIYGTQTVFGTQVGTTLSVSLAVGASITLSHLTANAFTYTKTVGLQIGSLTGGTQAAGTIYSIESTDSTAKNYFAGYVNIGTTAQDGKVTIKGDGNAGLTYALYVKDSIDAVVFYIKDNGVTKAATYKANQRTVTAPTTILETDRTILLNPDVPIVQPLPTAINKKGQRYTLKNIGVATVTVTCFGAEQIDPTLVGGGPSIIINPKESYIFESNDVNWYIVAKY